jgi:hypothetical protein
MAEKTYSQKVARVFEVISIVLLLPSAFGLFYAGILIVFGLSSGDLYISFCGLVPFILAAAGITLLVGYFKRSRDRLAEKYISALWIGTIIYNFLLLLPWVLVALYNVKSSSFEDGLSVLYAATALILVYAAAIYFAFKAYSLEKFVKI